MQVSAVVMASLLSAFSVLLSSRLLERLFAKMNLKPLLTIQHSTAPFLSISAKNVWLLGERKVGSGDVFGDIEMNLFVLARFHNSPRAHVRGVVKAQQKSLL